jgi:methionine-rich copper-binding protein CopC
MKKLLALMCALYFSLAFTPAAFAHAGVVSTTPSQDQSLTVMPSELKVTFSEDLLTLGDKQVNTISLTHFDGPPVEITDVTINGNAITASVPEGEYESGTYEVVYSVVSADGHKVSDSFTFSLNAPTLYAEPAVQTKSDGVIPAPIVGAIVIVVLVGGIYALRRKR